MDRAGIVKIDRCRVARVEGRDGERVERACGGGEFVLEVGSTVIGVRSGLVLFSAAHTDIDVMSSIEHRGNPGEVLFGGERVGFLRVTLGDGFVVVRVAGRSDEELRVLLA